MLSGDGRWGGWLAELQEAPFGFGAKLWDAVQEACLHSSSTRRHLRLRIMHRTAAITCTSAHPGLPVLDSAIRDPRSRQPSALPIKLPTDYFEA